MSSWRDWMLFEILGCIGVDGRSDFQVDSGCAGCYSRWILCREIGDECGHLIPDFGCRVIIFDRK